MLQYASMKSTGTSSGVPKEVFLFVGTTAELIKLAPVIRELRERKISFTIVASGQNDIHFEEFVSFIGDVKIIYAVTPKSKEPSLFLFSLWAVKTFFSLTIGMYGHFKGLDKTNSLFIVHGDTVSSLMGTLVARLYGLKIVHIESGLRSFSFLEPFPEELCRFIVSRLADVHFSPNSWSLNNLSHVKGEKINTQQNTLIESFSSVMKEKSTHPLVKQLAKERKPYYVLVVHRQEHVLFGRKKTAGTVRYVLSEAPKKLRCIFLVHDISTDFLHDLGKVIPQDIAGSMMRVDRLPYGDFMHLLKGAEFMVTDGGSNQEELYYMGKPCLLLRNRTERIEGLHENVVLGKDNRRIIREFLVHYRRYVRKPIMVSHPSKIIVDYLFGGI